VNDLNKPITIAIAGVSGSGKTVLTTHLATHTNNAKALFFDDYDLDGPDDVLEWVDRGADVHEWDLEPLIADLKKLMNQPLGYIFLDYPFAFRHARMKEFIDLAVFIETPLDLALARRISRDFQNSSGEEIVAQVNHYANYGRRAYIHMLETIQPDSDLLVDGTLTVETLADQIMETVGRLS
jgi:uridine kinase